MKTDNELSLGALADDDLGAKQTLVHERRTTCGVEFVVLGGWITRCGRWCGRYDDV